MSPVPDRHAVGTKDVDAVANLINDSKKLLVITGAGVSTGTLNLSAAHFAHSQLTGFLCLSPPLPCALVPQQGM